MAASPQPIDPPLSLDPVLGWRVWALERVDGVLTLRSITRADQWPPREAMEATCVRHHGSTTPSEHCSCGIYAASSPEHLARAGIFNSATGVVGAIAMWGTVVEHARGARSRFGYPARLRLVCGPCLAAGVGAIKAFSVVGVNGMLKVVCRTHRLRVSGPARPAAEVQSELLSTYGVDLLPIDRVARGLRSGPGRVVRPAGNAFRLAMTGIFRLIHLLFIVWIAMWVIAFALMIVAAVVGGFIHLFSGGSDTHPVARPSVVAPSTERAPDVRITLPPEVDEPYRGAMPAPPPTPAWFALVCGVGAGSRVDLVSCKEASDLFGFAELTEPTGARADCIKGWDAYTRGPHYWICWNQFGEQAFVHRWANAPNPFMIPRDEGGALDEHR